ncbi:MAG: T9SS type A sorting domain-containing protein [Flavobacteriales bacterium]
MSIFCRIGMAAAGLFLSLTAWAQECVPFEFWVVNQSDEGNAIAMNFAISNADGAVETEGVWEVTSAGLTAEFCLTPGCYSIALSGDEVSSETVGLELFQSDFVQILELTPAAEEGYWDAAFCIEQGWQYNCPDAIGYAEGEGCTWAFEIGSFQEGEEVMWNFGDGSEPIWGGHFIEYEFETAGTYEVNAFFTSYDCPMGVELQTVVEVSGCGEAECVLEMEVSTEDGMFYTFSIPDELANNEIQWYIDGQPIEGANSTSFEAGFDFNPNWSVCVDVYTEACPDGMEACYSNLEGSCTLELVWNEVECNQFALEAVGQPEGATLVWTLDGEFYDYLTPEIVFTFEEEGCHVFGVGYETPDCPEGVFAEVEICSDCPPMEECELNVDYVELSEGIYLFSVYTPNGELFDGELNWWTNGGYVGSENPFAWTWDLDEPMTMDMCFDYSSWQDCPSGEMCIQVESQGMACEEVQLVLDGSWTAEVDWAFELGLEAFIDGWEIAGWSFEETWSAAGELSDTLTICVPPACFDAFWGWEAANVDVESLLISVLIAGMDPVALFDWFDPFNDAGFGLLPDCMETVETDEIARELLNVWPNPASHSFQWKVPSDATGGEWTVYTADGRLVHSERTTAQAGTWNVATWPCGLYHAIFVADGRQPLRQQLVIYR